MKLYEKMRPGENLSWCSPYISDDQKTAVVMCDGEIISAIIDGELLNVPNDEVEAELAKRNINIDIDDLHEVGCAQCPFRDDCEAMNVEE